MPVQGLLKYGRQINHYGMRISRDKTAWEVMINSSAEMQCDIKLKLGEIINFGIDPEWPQLVVPLYQYEETNINISEMNSHLYLYNKFCVCVCLSVKYRRPNCWTDHDQIWHAYADRPGMVPT